jgi:hypothetical protein
MARARNIKPGVFRNELLSERPAIERLLFIGLWTLADREGRVEDRPKRIRLDLFPLDDYDVNEGLDSLASMGFVRRYMVGGKSVIQIENFLKHQTPHGTERDSELPAEDGSMTVCERNANGYVTGSKRSVNVKPVENNVSPQGSNSGPTVTAAPDLLIPDLLIPDSLNTTGDKSPKPVKPNRQKAVAMEITHWLTALKESGERAIPEEDPIFRWAADVGLPSEYLSLAWKVFKQRMADKGKKQADWRATFRGYVRGDYLKLWAMNANGEYFLTTAGKQEQLAHGA